MSTIERLYEVVLDGKRAEVVELVERALAEGLAPMTIVDETLRPAMGQVGELFAAGELFLPQLLLASSAMKMAMERLRPALVGTASAAHQETIVIGTVKGDLHDIGKNLVAATWEGAGYRVIDLGIDVQPATFVEMVGRHDPAVVGFSALLSTTMVHIPETIRALEDAGLRRGRLLAAGGAPVTQRNTDEWGVEIYAPDAGTAVRVINEALSRRGPASAAG